MASGSVSGLGRGGMASKIAAAKIATAAGCEVMIALGKTMHPLSSGGAKTTHFHASDTPTVSRKRWIAGVLKPEGVLIVDAGAAKALGEGKSLLPAGIRQIDGRFSRGDAVVVRDQEGRDIARGLAAYNVEDAERIAGRRTAEIEAILGYRGRDEMIHRDDLVML
jgi:glutamate 5-kinase